MRKFLLINLLLLISTGLFAKKVKFSVDLDTVTPNINGVHITGDFQDEAGFPADWDPATTQMFQEPTDTSIYSIVLDLPAFRKYEFKFVNGIFGYEVEFVPVESRVGYLFNDNRWIYIDSLSNDTQVVARVFFAGNAPAGKHLLRFKVDMRNEASISPNGVHVAGNFQGWDTAATYLYSFDGDIFEYITYVDSGMPSFEHEFKYFNGNSSGTQENVPTACSNANTNRGVYVSKDTVLIAVCFSQCSPCAGNGISEGDIASSINIFPNPSNGQFVIASETPPAGRAGKQSLIQVYNTVGEKVFSKLITSESETINLNETSGIYFLRIESNGHTSFSKLVIE